MTKLIGFSVAALVLAVATGCGSGNLADPPTADLGFARVWDGEMIVGTAPFDPSPTAYAAKLRASVSGYQVRIGGLCPDGTGVIVARSSSDKAEWTGALSCAPANIGPCTAEVVTLHTILFTLMGDTLAASGQGVASGCGRARDILFAYSGGPEVLGPPAPINPAFAGRWSGDLTVTTSAPGTTTLPNRTMTITTGVGTALLVGGLCPGASSEIVLASGHGEVLQWYGNMICESSTSLAGCPDALVRYTSATATLLPSGALDVGARGDIAACGATVSATATMVMTR